MSQLLVLGFSKIVCFTDDLCQHLAELFYALDAQEKQALSIPDIVSAAISDPYILIHKKDGSVSLFVGSTTQGAIEESPVFTVGISYTRHDQNSSHQ